MIVFDFTGVALLLGEIVVDLDTIDVAVGFTVVVPVLETDVEPDTEFVELELTVKLSKGLLVIETEDEIDGDDVGEFVEHAVIDSEIVWELDPV